RHIGDDDAFGRGGVEVHAVDANAAVGDYFAGVEPADDVRVERATADDDRVRVLDLRHVCAVTIGVDRGDGDAERAERLVLVRIAVVDTASKRGCDYAVAHRSWCAP